MCRGKVAAISQQSASLHALLQLTCTGADWSSPFFMGQAQTICFRKYRPGFAQFLCYPFSDYLEKLSSSTSKIRVALPGMTCKWSNAQVLAAPFCLDTSSS